jgi:hypothetical protein
VLSDEWRETDNPMNNKITALTVCALLLAVCFSASAQQPAKIPRIGYLSSLSLSALVARTDAFRQGLRERIGSSR